MPLPTRRQMLTALPVVLAGARVRASEALTLFAAASIADAAAEIASAFERQTGTAVRLSAAASSTLARQVEAGAPADLFISANVAWMDRLSAAGLLESGTRRKIAGNRLVLVAPAEQAAPPRSGDVRALLAEASGRIAVGDPAHVPAGIYAAAALRTMGLWDQLSPRLAHADNARAALALVSRGVAPLGIVYATDAALARVVVLGQIDTALHPPIVYPGAIVAGRASAPSRALLDRFAGPVGREVLAAHGFRAPQC